MKSRLVIWGSQDEPPERISPRPGWEAGMAVLFFAGLLLAAYSTSMAQFHIISDTVATIIPIVFLVLILGIIIWSGFLHFPDWSLLFMGFLTAIGSVGMLIALFRFHGIIWMALFYTLLPLLIIFLASRINPLRPLWLNMQQDPTRLGYLYLGWMGFSYIIILGGVPIEEVYKGIVILALLPAAVGYLRVRHLWQRMIVLPAGFLVSWIIYILMFPDLFHQPLGYSWNNGLKIDAIIGLLLLAWFCLPGIYILLRQKYGAAATIS